MTKEMVNGVMKMTEAIERLILENWKRFHDPITLGELRRLLESALTEKVDIGDVKSIVGKLKAGGAIREVSADAYVPLHDEVR